MCPAIIILHLWKVKETWLRSLTATQKRVKPPEAPSSSSSWTTTDYVAKKKKIFVRFIRPTPQWPSLNSKCTVKCNQLTDEGGNRLCGYAQLLDERIAWAERRYHTSLSRLFRCVDVAQIYFYTQQPELMLFTLVTFVLFFSLPVLLSTPIHHTAPRQDHTQRNRCERDFLFSTKCFPIFQKKLQKSQRIYRKRQGT